MSGEHQVAQIPILRDDASLGEVSLMVVNSREVAGGSSSYEVINQFQAVKGDGSERNRRFDVTLLINGLPLIHIELKNRDHPFMDAFRQITKYCEEGKFRGLMGLVQMFVVSNGEQWAYRHVANSGTGTRPRIRRSLTTVQRTTEWMMCRQPAWSSNIGKAGQSGGVPSVCCADDGAGGMTYKHMANVRENSKPLRRLIRRLID